MKKFLCVLLAALMLGGFGGAAAVAGGIQSLWETPTASPESESFRFRGGVQWNMSREQVRGLETAELVERSRDSWSILYPQNKVEVSRYTADLVYMFYNDQLKMIYYEFGAGGTEADFAYLTGALDSIYGSHREAEPIEIIGVMDQIYNGYYKADKIVLPRGWKAGEDTLIYLYYYDKEAYAILYVCVGETPGNYVTDGL